MSTRPTIVIAGYSHGLGSSLRDRFIAGGFDVVTVARSGDAQYSFDLSDAEATAELFKLLDKDHGPIKAVVHNAMRYHRGSFLTTAPETFETVWRAMVLTAINTAQQAIPRMAHHGGGTLVVSGSSASLQVDADFAALSTAKFALRGICQSMAQAHAADGVRVVHAVIDGLIWCDQTRQRILGAQRQRTLLPADLAECYWNLCHQPASLWSPEVTLRPLTRSH